MSRKKILHIINGLRFKRPILPANVASRTVFFMSTSRPPSFRKDGKPRQRVLATLGRRDRLEADGTINSLVESLAKFSQKFRVLRTRATSVSIYRDTETEWRKRGYSRDHRPDLPQLVLGVAVDRKGWPVSWEVFPGNTADPEAFEAMIAKMRTRFRIGRVVVVADRGMIEKKSLEPLTTGKTPHD
jgi:transposase